MSFNKLVRRLTIPREEFILQAMTIGSVRDEIGDFQKEWTDQYTLNGIIQEASQYREGERGQEEIPLYRGFFEADFSINFDDLGNYRIKHYIPTTSPQTLLYQIKSINRDLRLKNKQNHYQMDLELNRKW